MINNHIQTIKEVAMSPKKFFEGLKATEGYKKSTIFAIINSLLGLIISMVLSIILRSQEQPMPVFIAGLVIGIPVMIIVLFIFTAVLQVIAKVLGGKGNFFGTYQTLAYSTALTPLTSLPGILMSVSFIFSIYQLYIVIIGLKKVHGYSTTKAVLNVVMPVFVMIIAVIVVVAIFGVALVNFFKASGVNPEDLKSLQNIQSPQDLQKLYPTFAPITGENMDPNNDYNNSNDYNSPSL